MVMVKEHAVEIISDCRVEGGLHYRTINLNACAVHYLCLFTNRCIGMNILLDFRLFLVKFI